MVGYGRLSRDEPTTMPKREPEFRRIARELTEAIRSGEMLPGSALPTLAELAEAEGVSVSTIQRALVILDSQGLIEGQQGKAVYVAQQRR